MKLYEKFCFSWGKKLVNLQYAISHVPWSLVSVQPTKILFIIHIRILQEHFPWNFIVQEINDFEKCSKKGPYVPKNLANDFKCNACSIFDAMLHTLWDDYYVEWLFCAATIYPRCMVHTHTTLFLHNSTAPQVAYLRHRELSIIDGRILFWIATLGALLSLLHQYYYNCFLYSFLSDDTVARSLID